jgi:probable phosphoglycerate mutase
VLLRHGETEWSLAGRHTGRTDLPLLPRGEAQAVAARSALEALLLGRPAALVLTSPLRRATRTAELAASGATRDADLREVDYGEFEGLTTPEIRRQRPGWTVWTGDLPGGETLADVAERSDRVLARARAALDHGDVVLVAHGHLLRVLTACWLGLAPTAGQLFALGTAALCVLGTEHEAPAVIHWNLPNPGQ